MSLELYSRKNLRQLKAIKLKFQRNHKGFWKRYRLWIFLLLLAALLDCLSTCYFMTQSGIHKELHPHILWISCHLGPIWGPIAGKSAQIAFGLPIIIFVRKHATALFSVTSFFYASAAFINFMAYGGLRIILIDLFL